MVKFLKDVKNTWKVLKMPSVKNDFQSVGIVLVVSLISCLCLTGIHLGMTEIITLILGI